MPFEYSQLWNAPQRTAQPSCCTCRTRFLQGSTTCPAPGMKPRGEACAGPLYAAEGGQRHPPPMLELLASILLRLGSEQCCGVVCQHASPKYSQSPIRWQGVGAAVVLGCPPHGWCLLEVPLYPLPKHPSTQPVPPSSPSGANWADGGTGSDAGRFLCDASVFISANYLC